MTGAQTLVNVNGGIGGLQGFLGNLTGLAKATGSIIGAVNGGGANAAPTSGNAPNQVVNPAYPLPRVEDKKTASSALADVHPAVWIGGGVAAVALLVFAMKS